MIVQNDEVLALLHELTTFTGREDPYPRFDRLRTFTGLGDGRHTLKLVVDPPEGNRRLAYVDYFRAFGKTYRTE